MARPPRVHVLGVDGGNSKTDVVLAASDGTLLAAVRGASVSHQAVGIEAGTARLLELAAEARAIAGVADTERAEVGVFCLAGADTPADVRQLNRVLGGLELTRLDLLRNDTEAALRAGSDRGWGVAVICGSGVNAFGRALDGRTTRLAALGDISGDWGGGGDIGRAALAAAIRGRDGRGERTALERLVPAAFALRRPASLTDALYSRRLDSGRLRDLAPVVFRAAIDGDAMARGIIDRQADEIVAMAGAMLRRLRLTRQDADVVFVGGVMQATDAAFHARIRDGLLRIAPRARIVVPVAPPVLGAALLALDALPQPLRGSGRNAGRRLRAALEAWRPG